VRTADCVAVLIADRRGRTAAAVHAGWRGVAAGIVRHALRCLSERGFAPGDLVVALGPAIGPCCYEVGDDVAARVLEASGGPSGVAGRTAGGGRSIDLHAALRAQLSACGVPAASSAAAPWCTRCRRDLFFSHRGEGAGCGRLMAAIGPAARP
jgi:YfiH family protein